MALGADIQRAGKGGAGNLKISLDILTLELKPPTNERYSIQNNQQINYSPIQNGIV